MKRNKSQSAPDLGGNSICAKESRGKQWGTRQTPDQKNPKKPASIHRQARLANIRRVAKTGSVFTHSNFHLKGRTNGEVKKGGAVCSLRILETNHLKLPSRSKPHIEEKLLERKSKLICAGITETKDREKRGKGAKTEELRLYEAMVFKHATKITEEEAQVIKLEKLFLPTLPS